MDSRSRRATLFGFLAIGLWATLAVLTTAAGGIPTFQLLALTFGLAGGMGCAWLLRPGGAGIAALRQPPGAAVLTIAALAGYHSLYFIAFARAPAVEVNLVNYLWPLLIVVFAGLLPGVRVYARQWVGTLLGLAGAVLVVSRGHSLAMQPQYIAGYLAALGAAFTWSAYSVLNRRYGSVSSSAMAGSCPGGRRARRAHTHGSRDLGDADAGPMGGNPRHGYRPGWLGILVLGQGHQAR